MKIVCKLNPPSWANFTSRKTTVDVSKDPDTNDTMKERRFGKRFPSGILVRRSKLPPQPRKHIAGYKRVDELGVARANKVVPNVIQRVPMTRAVSVPARSKIIPPGKVETASVTMLL